MDKGLSAQATALVEAYEESGLLVRLVRHLVDVKRSTSYARYYLAERVVDLPGLTLQLRADTKKQTHVPALLLLQDTKI